jgi:long-chain acyl-CoA synthetase
VTHKSAWACFAALEKRDVASRAWITTDKRELTFADLSKRIRLVAALARRRGLAIGDRVVIATDDDCEAALLFAALICNGLTAVQLDPNTHALRARALAAKAAPSLVIADAALVRDWAFDTLGCEVIEIAKPAARQGLLAGLMRAAPKVGLAAVLEDLQPEEPPREVPPETLAYILFTSGTTLEPKGVCISHRALFSHLDTLSRVYGCSAESRILNTLMLSHADGVVQGPMLCFYNGAQLHRPLKFEITTLDRLLDSVFRLRITHMIAVPTMLSLMARFGADAEDTFQGGDFKLLVSCGAALEAGLWEEFERKFHVSILNLYGLTETVAGGVFAGGPAGTIGYGAIGVPIDCELRVVDDDGAEAPPGDPGELLMRGSLLMSGYFDDPAQTAEVLRDGWLSTGDIARRDADGSYWVCGRKKNIVIRGGLNIHPEEITEALNRHPAVADAFAFGAPDPEWGEKLLALAVSETADETELLRHCAELLEPRKIPSQIRIVEALPKGRSGKVVAAEARALFEGPAVSSPATGDISARLLAIAAHTFKLDVGQLRLASTPDDVLGWDSLAHLNFVTAIESEFSVRLTPRQIMGLTSIGKALEYVG